MQTKQLCIRNIVFIKDGETLDHNSPSLYLADCVSVTFKRQKNDRKADTVTQWQTSDELLCKIWASITRRILSYKRANKNSPVSLVKHKSQTINVTGEMTAETCHPLFSMQSYPSYNTNGSVTATRVLLVGMIFCKQICWAHLKLQEKIPFFRYHLNE